MDTHSNKKRHKSRNTKPELIITVPKTMTNEQRKQQSKILITSQLPNCNIGIRGGDCPEGKPYMEGQEKNDPRSIAIFNRICDEVYNITSATEKTIAKGELKCQHQ
jgi:hypothetical protein